MLLDDLKTYTVNDNELPLIIEPVSAAASLASLLDLLQRENSHFRKLLLKHKGLLFRNFGLSTAEDFREVIKALNMGSFINYIGGDSPRKRVVDGVYTSTEAPPSIKIPLHNELSYTKNHPKHIYFFCETPPVKKGETTLADAHRIYQSIDPEVRKRFESKGIRYISSYYHQNKFLETIGKIQPGCFQSWCHVFNTRCQKEVERLCQEGEFGFEWHPTGWLKLIQTRPATHSHPETTEPLWFNQAHLFDLSPGFLGWWRYLGTKLIYFKKHTQFHEVFYADGTPICRKDLAHVLEVLEKNTLLIPWQKGDMMVLDNLLAMHGRSDFKGPRRILTAMTG